MKKVRIFKLAIVVFITVCSFAVTETMAQNQPEQAGSVANTWRHQYKYARITSASIFDKGMTDDEMAGILMWRSGRNLKLSFAFITVGFVSSSTLAYIKDPPAAAQIAIACVSTGFLIAGIIELVCGYSKIGKAGIILQHKRFNVKTTGTSISLNF
jgi:hypothetical protein